jgi:hypothetical protein
VRTRVQSGVVGAAVSGLLAVAALAHGRAALAAGLFLVQVLLGAGWVGLLELPGTPALLSLVVLCALAGDASLVVRGGARLGGLTAVLAATFVVGLVVQLANRHRRLPTQSLAGLASGGLIVLAAASLLGLHDGPAGRRATVVCLVAVAGACLAARVVPAGRAALAPLAGLVVAALVGLALGAAFPAVGKGYGTLLGLAAGGAATIAALAIDPVTTGGPHARRSGVVPALFPLASAAPAAYLLGRLLFS